MASQVVTTTSADQELSTLELSSFVRGYHSYQAIWDPKVGDVLRLQREPTNCKDRYAVAVMDAASTAAQATVWKYRASTGSMDQRCASRSSGKLQTI